MENPAVAVVRGKVIVRRIRQKRREWWKEGARGSYLLSFKRSGGETSRERNQ